MRSRGGFKDGARILPGAGLSRMTECELDRIAIGRSASDVAGSTAPEQLAPEMQ